MSVFQLISILLVWTSFAQSETVGEDIVSQLINCIQEDGNKKISLIQKGIIKGLTDCSIYINPLLAAEFQNISFKSFEDLSQRYALQKTYKSQWSFQHAFAKEGVDCQKVPSGLEALCQSEKAQLMAQFPRNNFRKTPTYKNIFAEFEHQVAILNEKRQNLANMKFANKRPSPVVEEILFEEAKVAYSDLALSKYGQLYFTQHMIERLGATPDPEIVEFQDDHYLIGSIPNSFPLRETDIQLAKTQLHQHLVKELKALQSGELNLNFLLLNHPESVGRALRDSPGHLDYVCHAIVEIIERDESIEVAMDAVDATALAVSFVPLVGWAGGLALRGGTLAGRVVVSRVIAGATSRVMIGSGAALSLASTGTEFKRMSQTGELESKLRSIISKAYNKKDIGRYEGLFAKSVKEFLDASRSAKLAGSLLPIELLGAKDIVDFESVEDLIQALRRGALALRKGSDFTIAGLQKATRYLLRNGDIDFNTIQEVKKQWPFVGKPGEALEKKIGSLSSELGDDIQIRTPKTQPGSGSDVFLLSSNGKDVAAVKIFPYNSEKDLIQESIGSHIVSEAGLIVPKIKKVFRIEINGQERVGVLMDIVPGQSFADKLNGMLTEASVSSETLLAINSASKSVGSEMAQFHRFYEDSLPQKLTKAQQMSLATKKAFQVSSTRKAFDENIRSLKDNKLLTPEQNKGLQQKVERALKAYDSHTPLGTTGLHGDMHLGNIHFTGSSRGHWLDFDTVAKGLQSDQVRHPLLDLFRMRAKTFKLCQANTNCNSVVESITNQYLGNMPQKYVEQFREIQQNDDLFLAYHIINTRSSHSSGSTGLCQKIYAVVYLTESPESLPETCK